MSVPMTFGELCRNCTPDEREALAWHLGMIRLRETVRILAKPTAKEGSDA